MKPRTLARYIERKLGCGKLFLSADDNDGQYIFSTKMGRIIGLIDRGDYYDLHDMHNPEDQPGKPTAQILKGKKLRIQWTTKSGEVKNEH